MDNAQERVPVTKAISSLASELEVPKNWPTIAQPSRIAFCGPSSSVRTIYSVMKEVNIFQNWVVTFKPIE